MALVAKPTGMGTDQIKIHFDCTMCGKCCHGLKLPLSIDEAAAWLRRGGTVQLLCEATPWAEEPPETDAAAQRMRQRSFAARCGALPVRIGVTLVASFEGACPHLLADMRCGAYEERPAVCRIYPAETNPLMPLVPERKSCPPEAWAPTQPLYAVAGRPVDAETARQIDRSREATIADVQPKAQLCAALGIDIAALANEGFAVHIPDETRLSAALDGVRRGAHPDTALEWRIASNRQVTLDMLADAGAVAMPKSGAGPGGLEFLGFFPDS